MTLKFYIYIWPEDGDLVLLASIFDEYLWSWGNSHYLYKSHPKEFGWVKVGKL